METNSANHVLATEIRRVHYSDILGAPNAAVLLSEYAAECCLPEIGEPSPQGKMYAAMEDSGMLSVFGAFQWQELIGFAALLVYVLPHYGLKIATVESIFVARQHRSSAGRALMKTIEQHARELGCVAILYNAPAGSQLETLLALLKPYRRTNSVFCRSLN